MIIGYYGISVVLTYLGVAAAVFGMAAAIQQNITATMMCLLICGVCDMFDGTVAKRTKRTEQEKAFGVQIDSLADIVNFGVFPAVIGYALGFEWVGHLLILVVYILAALIRLAYFNVTEMEREGPRDYYEGLPVTGAALIIPIVYFFCEQLGAVFADVYRILLVVLAAAFVVRFRVPKPKLKHLLVIFLIGLVFAVLLVLTLW